MRALRGQAGDRHLPLHDLRGHLPGPGADGQGRARRARRRRARAGDRGRPAAATPSERPRVPGRAADDRPDSTSCSARARSCAAALEGLRDPAPGGDPSEHQARFMLVDKRGFQRIGFPARRGHARAARPRHAPARARMSFSDPPGRIWRSMMFSTKAEYGVRVMAHLARHARRRPDLARRDRRGRGPAAGLPRAPRAAAAARRAGRVPPRRARRLLARARTPRTSRWPRWCRRSRARSPRSSASPRTPTAR